ncbi:hypothetical protein DFP72DRAFT_856103 [Ephemerocybe angulata]|uniref:Uncharacterized protein n=1 Tax=Ephemerocybe angulata TaxID=980116 RepID=A0A8H6HER5_9AGAR|nr:hypothetical protein DFP72DRAFT_856103 [Tulosesus angulatus]
MSSQLRRPSGSPNPTTPLRGAPRNVNDSDRPIGDPPNIPLPPVPSRSGRTGRDRHPVAPSVRGRPTHASPSWVGGAGGARASESVRQLPPTPGSAYSTGQPHHATSIPVSPSGDRASDQDRSITGTISIVEPDSGDEAFAAPPPPYTPREDVNEARSATTGEEAPQPQAVAQPVVQIAEVPPTPPSTSGGSVDRSRRFGQFILPPPETIPRMSLIYYLIFKYGELTDISDLRPARSMPDTRPGSISPEMIDSISASRLPTARTARTPHSARNLNLVFHRQEPVERRRQEAEAPSQIPDLVLCHEPTQAPRVDAPPPSSLAGTDSSTNQASRYPQVNLDVTLSRAPVPSPVTFTPVRRATSSNPLSPVGLAPPSAGDKVFGSTLTSQFDDTTDSDRGDNGPWGAVSNLWQPKKSKKSSKGPKSRSTSRPDASTSRSRSPAGASSSRSGAQRHTPTPLVRVDEPGDGIVVGLLPVILCLMKHGVVQVRQQGALGGDPLGKLVGYMTHADLPIIRSSSGGYVWVENGAPLSDVDTMLWLHFTGIKKLDFEELKVAMGVA